ncbi:AMSH-like ubiquitin thioesterase 2 isoform X2 [Ananas comosus]|uniref:AMSH-like ubiquitin thioesterase 2 isoform X2 n=1 Tax=Ananas comosus TaxID=4615 RepID=A0A6P5FYL8_ANACO|nr:AMSH-like ubiquitin thioesterase 2 isoform X2 [Ananas comosus]
MVFNSKVLRCRSRRKQSKRFENTTSTDNVEVSPNSAADAKACCTQTETPFQVAVTMARDRDICVYAVKHHYPPIDSCIEDFPPVGRVSLVIQPESRNEYLETSSAESSNSSALRDMHISARLMEEFMVLAGDNTSQNLETCGVLGAFLKNGTFYVTTLIIPKQETTAHSCQALNEEEIHAILDGESLFPAGWIHTHPSQTCFLSSIDLHTQYPYQVMLPEAVAIVMAPTDSTRNYGIFRLTNPGGIAILKECKESGFHSHPDTSDGSPLFECCSNIYINHNLRLEIIDLRSSSPR